MARYQIISLILGSFGLISIAISNVVEALGEKIAPIAWIASTFMMLEILYLKTKIDPSKFSEYINKTNPYVFSLNPSRYLNWMSLAMIIGLISTIIIWFDFILGMIFYLLMQICLITAFSGIMSLNPLKYLKEGSTGPIISLVSWVILVVVIYTFGVYSGSESLVVIPYVIFLGLMAHYTWYNLSFTDRVWGFKLFTILASSIFVFSDAMIGNARFGSSKLPDSWFFFIDTTYVINLFFMINALLFLPLSSGKEKQKSI